MVSTHKTKYTWQEVAKHNTADSAWVIVDRKVYDITEFLDRHPGGKEMLLLSAGRECTHLFNMYHALSDRPRKYLESYIIGELSGESEMPNFAPEDPKTGFYAVMSKRVAQHFKQSGKDPKAVTPGLVRVIPMLAVAGFCYMLQYDLIFPGTALWIKTVAAVIFGWLLVLPLMHWMHDASHAAIGHTETWWKFLGRLSLEWYQGASMISWHHQHVVGHHVYTNVFEADPDLPVALEGDIRRVVPKQFMSKVYRFQQWYLPVLYGVLTLKFRLQDITGTYFDRSNGPIRVNYTGNAMLRLWLPKLAWVAWRVLLPLFVFNVPTSTFWALFFLTEFVAGWYLAFNFQVSHITGDCAFVNGEPDEQTPSIVTSKPAKDGKIADGANPNDIADSWAVSQCKTSVSYGHNSPFLAFMTGALNYQVEHHLFPGVSQYHYPAIAKIVKETCKEFRVPYRYVHGGFWAAWACHWRWLKDLGEQGIGASVHVD